MEAISNVREMLQEIWNVKKQISWSWVLVKLIKILENYPSGVTKTIVLSELYQEFLRTGGKLSLSKHVSTRSSSVAAIHEVRAVGYDAVLEAVADRLWNIPGTSTLVISLRDPGREDGNEARQIEMYLHRKFQDHTEVLTTHTLRLTCCRLQPVSHTDRHSSQPLWLLPSEHLIILLHPEEEPHMMTRFAALSEVESSECAQPSYIRDVFAKVHEVGEEEVVHSPDGTAFRRLVVTLSSGVCSVQLVLWDHYTSLARLWSKGDLLFLERPYAKPVAAGRQGEGERWWCLEIGPATVLYLSPFIPEEEIIPTQMPSVPAHVQRTDQGRLDFSSYPHRLVVADLVPRMNHGVLLAWCDSLERREEIETGDGSVVQKCSLHISDSTGSIVCDVWSMDRKIFRKIYPYQWVLLTGLSSHTRSESGSLFLCCDTRQGGSLHSVSSLVGWLRSPFLLSHICLSVAVSTPHSTTPHPQHHHFTTLATLTRWQVTSTHTAGSDVEGRPGPVKRIHSVCGDEVIEAGGQLICTSCNECDVGSCEWQYNLQCTLQDCPATGLDSPITRQDGATLIRATLTPTAAETFLQVPVGDFVSLSPSEQLNLLNTHCSHTLLLCLSRIDADQQLYQINALCKAAKLNIQS